MRKPSVVSLYSVFSYSRQHQLCQSNRSKHLLLQGLLVGGDKSWDGGRRGQTEVVEEGGKGERREENELTNLGHV